MNKELDLLFIRKLCTKNYWKVMCYYGPAGSESTSGGEEDFFQDAWIWINEKLPKYNFEKNTGKKSFETWINYQIKGLVSTILAKYNARKEYLVQSRDSIKDFDTDMCPEFDSYDTTEVKLILHKFFKKLLENSKWTHNERLILINISSNKDVTPQDIQKISRKMTDEEKEEFLNYMNEGGEKNI